MRNMNTLELLDLLSEALESKDIKKEIEKLRDSIVFSNAEPLPEIDISKEGYLKTKQLAIEAVEDPNLTSSIVVVDTIGKMMKEYFDSSALGLEAERVNSNTLHVTVSLRLGNPLVQGSIIFLTDIKRLYNSESEEV